MTDYRDKTEVKAAVLALLDERFGPLKQEASLADLGLDSVDVLDALASLERHFTIVFEQDQLAELERLGDLVELVYRNLGLSAEA